MASHTSTRDGLKNTTRFTPKAMLSAPRRSVGVPNPSGTTILFTTSSYSFQKHVQTTSLRALSVESGSVTELATNQNISSMNWLNDERFICLRCEDNGTTSILFADLTAASRVESRIAGIINAAASNMKLARIDDTSYAIALSAPACEDGQLFTPEVASRKTRSSGRLYDSLFVRHWDRYEGPDRNALWYGKLSLASNGDCQLSGLTNLFAGMDIEAPSRPFGGTDEFDIRKDAIIWSAKDPDSNPSMNTKCRVYVQRIVSWDSATAENRHEGQEIMVPGLEGAAVSPIFAPKGNKAAFLMMRRNKYEADKNQIIVVPDITASNPETVRAFSSSEAQAFEGSWDRSPLSLCFAADGESLIATADEMGFCRAFVIDGKIEEARIPRPITQTGTAIDIRPLADGRVFVSGSSLIDDSWYAIIDPLADFADTRPGLPPRCVWSHSNTNQGEKLGLHSHQFSSIWTPAANPSITKEIQSWTVKPANFDSTKKYPVAYIIHGGPHASWKDFWSTRWNPAVFAEQGYIVVLPNITGSTGFGQAFTDANLRNWGGDPYEDIVNLFEWVGENVQGADNERAVALGHSYGGYMMNWIQGHDLGRKLKTLVNHNGLFSSVGMLSTEELHFHYYEMDGPPWLLESEADSFYDGMTRSDVERRRWDPSLHMMKWSTPQLVIHSDKDYRVTAAEGLAQFNMLQARGVPSQYLTFPDENHWVVKAENSLVWHKTVLNWINRWVGLPEFTEEDPKGTEYWGGISEEI